MLRFRIFQNINIPPYNIEDINRSRYNRDDYMFEREIEPIWNNLSYRWEKDDGRAFFRKHLNGEFVLDGADFNWVEGIRADEYDINRYRYMVIEEKKDGLWKEEWAGFFTVADAELDLTSCTATFSDLLVFDEYTSILENIEKEVNLIDLPTTFEIGYDANQYAYDSTFTTEEISITDFCGDEYWETGDVFMDTKYSLYTKKYRLTFGRGRWTGSSCEYSATFAVTKEWRRDYQYAASSPGGAWEDTGETDINGNSKWVRHYRGNESPSYSLKKTRVEYSTIPKLTEFEKYCNYCALYNIDYTLRGIGNSAYTNDRGRTFADAVIYAIKDYINFFDAEGGLLPAYQSQFFGSATNPINGLDNVYNSIIWLQLSDMKPTSNAATRAMYSVETIEEFIALFQCKWHIDENGYFIIEHDKFYDNGRTYTGENSVGLDISDQNIQVTVSYTEDLPYRETMALSYAINPDFVGLPIDCYGNVVNRREDVSVKDNSFLDFVTDLNQVVSNPSDIGNDGIFALTADIDNLAQTATVHTTTGILTGITLSNGYMSISQIQDYFWKYGRSLGSGIMNRELTAFTQKRILKHPDIITSDCSDLDPNKLVKTSYGDGEVVTAEKTLLDGTLTLELRY